MRTVAAGLAFVGLTALLQFPVFFRVGFSRGRLMSYAPALVTAGVLWLVQATGTTDVVTDAFAGVSVPLMVGVACAIGVGGVVVATALSTRLYRSREI